MRQVKIKSYHKHIANILNSVITHLHQASLDAIAFRNLQRDASVMCIIHHHNKFRPLTSSKGWSHAMTHSITAYSNFSWFHGPCHNIVNYKQWKTTRNLTYNSMSLLILEHFLDVLRRFFELLEVFSFGLPIQLPLSRCDINFFRHWRLVVIFEDGIELIHRLHMNVQIVHEN